MYFESKEKEQKIMDMVNKEIEESSSLTELRLMIMAGFLSFSKDYRDYPSIEIINDNYKEDFQDTYILTFEDNPDYELFEDEDYFKTNFCYQGRSYDYEGFYNEDGDYFEFSDNDYKSNVECFGEDLKKGLLQAQDYAMSMIKEYNVNLLETITTTEKNKINMELDNTDKDMPSKKRRI